MTISKKIVNVIVNQRPEPIACNATARPEPHFLWLRKGESEILSEGPVLTFDNAFTQRRNETFICLAINRIGNETISTFINVQCTYLSLHYLINTSFRSCMDFQAITLERIFQ